MSDDEREALIRHWWSLLTVPHDQIQYIRSAIDRLLDRIAESRTNGQSWNRAARRALLLDDDQLM